MGGSDSQSVHRGNERGREGARERGSLRDRTRLRGQQERDTEPRRVFARAPDSGSFAACCRESGPLVSLLLLFSELAPDDRVFSWLPGRRQDVPVLSAVAEAERGGPPTSQQLWKEEQQRSLASEAGSWHMVGANAGGQAAFALHFLEPGHSAVAAVCAGKPSRVHACIQPGRALALSPPDTRGKLVPKC